MHVIYFQRKPHSNHFSIEKVFKGIRKHLPSHVKAETYIARYMSSGVLNRVYNTLEVIFNQGDINHITGDIHYVAILLRKDKTILTIHDCGFMKHPSQFARMILGFFWLKWPVKRAKFITVISEATKREVVKYTHCDTSKIVVIPDFVADGFYPCPLPVNKKPILLQIGTKVNKNIARLAEAIQGLNVELRIIGRLTRDDEKVITDCNLDYKTYSNLSEDELIEQYRKCDILTFVSTLEGFGMPIIEAQAIGRPVITSNISAMPEVAGPGGACLVNPHSTNSIRNGILKIIEDTAYRDRLVSAGFENVKKYNIKSVTMQYYKLYDKVYNNKNLV